MVTKREWLFLPTRTDAGMMEMRGFPPSYPGSPDDLVVRTRIEVMTDGKPACTMLAFESQVDGPTVTATTIKDIDIPGLIDQAIRAQAVAAKSADLQASTGRLLTDDEMDATG